MTLPEFEHTVATSRNRLYGFAVRMLGDREEAADVVQDGLIKLWDHRHAVDSGGSLGWLLRVTRNACIDRIRRRQFERELFSEDADPEVIAGASPGPERQAASGILRSHLERAFERLDEPYRSIVLLREVEDFRYDEIAGALDLPMSTVKVYLHRGRKKLRAIIQEDLHGELV